MSIYNDDAWVDEVLSEIDDEMYTESDDESDDESYAGSDDEIIGESDDDFYGTSSETGEFVGQLASRGIGAAISGVRNLIRKKPRSSKSIRSLRPGGNFLRHSFPTRTPNVSGTSNLSGVLNTNKGPFNFRLPPNVATKEDLKKVISTIAVNNKRQEGAIKKNAEAIKGNVAAIRKTNADLQAFDKKHSAVELRQSKIIESLNKGIVAVRKEAAATKQQIQMQSMMSLIMQPKLETIKLQGPAVNGVTPPVESFTVTESKFKSDMLPLLMMMSSSGESGSGNIMNNPMMMYFMFNK